jgi:hypothetical protein
MTATTLSTLKNVPLVVESLPDRRRGLFAAGVAELSDAQPHRVIRLCPPAPAVRGQRPPRRLDADALEHKARGLLNLIAVVTRCAQGGGATADERREWQRQIDDATAQLEAFYAAGLSRSFMTDKPAAR